MMRLVFLLAAEERGLLLLGEPRYDSFYAVSTLRMQLRAENEEILERRRSAWSRLLAVFRAVFGGIDHPTLHLPAMGGSLFDPDRFPFLEGRQKGTTWQSQPAAPLPIDDRTVLLLLEAIQTFEGRTLSYRALDVEQIGQVYEGLLERTVRRVQDVTLELDGSAEAKDPRVTLGELESARLDGIGAVVTLFAERSRRSESSLRNALAREVEARLGTRLLTACRGDIALRDRLRPYARLIRTDPWGYPLVHPKGAFLVVMGVDRRQTGTHYTPKSLTEKVVEETLSPLVYHGPARGSPKESWSLKSPGELLELKVCDPAMGSGAFLVQACRFLAARLVEAWAVAKDQGRFVDAEGLVHESNSGGDPLPEAAEARAELARRLVAERCLYGVDINPLSVELAKLSLWLVTLSKGRPFGFLDHNLRSGDSLLGIVQIEHLTDLTLDSDSQSQQRLFGTSIRKAVDDALRIRLQLRRIRIHDIRDVEMMSGLDAEARERLRVPHVLADAFVSTFLATENANSLESRLAALACEADSATQGNAGTLTAIGRRANRDLSLDAINGRMRAPFHWPIEFPEVFQRPNSGFHAVIGNPPFLGGKKISTILGEAYRKAVVALTAHGRKGAADLCAYFLLRANQLLQKPIGLAGMLSTDSICDGDNATVALRGLSSEGAHLISAVTSMPWPGKAGVSIAVLCWVASDRSWEGRHFLNGRSVERIQWDLTTTTDAPAREIHALKTGTVESFAGSYINGEGFLLSPDEARTLIEKDPRNGTVVKPYLTGADLNNQVRQQPTRWVVDFGTMPRSMAEQFRECFGIVTARVKPYRDTLTKQVHEPDYWKFWDKRLSSYGKIARFNRVLVAARAAKDVQLTWVKNEGVFSDQLVVFITESSGIFAVLQSTVHNIWAWDVCTGMWGSGIRYAPSKAISTFPLPTDSEGLRDMGERYYQTRLNYEREEGIGLTELYNRFHDPSNTESRVLELRALHEEMDLLVLGAYGWNDVLPRYQFDSLPSGPRRVLIPGLRTKILDRLVDLNNKVHSLGSESRQRRSREVSNGGQN
ncbi:MAG TPA: ATP phosphoribosyltransferase regulatory subunit [Phycisphaerae bacterium]|nr:ATP phosphoribosyltransferase regulatory subunit [Phycisphaerae bacterium]